MKNFLIVLLSWILAALISWWIIVDLTKAIKTSNKHLGQISNDVHEIMMNYTDECEARGFIIARPEKDDEGKK